MQKGSIHGSWKDVSDEEINVFASEKAFSTYHPTSSCRMGDERDGGVVDQQLRVHGFENLRIADASIFPKITSAHTMAPTLMIAERCADFMKEAARGARIKT
jgi:choline dehydrogenase-like flavoprotein